MAATARRVEDEEVEGREAMLVARGKEGGLPGAGAWAEGRRG